MSQQNLNLIPKYNQWAQGHLIILNHLTHAIKESYEKLKYLYKLWLTQVLKMNT